MIIKKHLGKILNLFLRFWFDMNRTQYQTLESFKAKLISEELLRDFVQFDDLYLLRFLRARKFDIDKTFLMFKTFLQWRKDNQVDQIEVKYSNLIRYQI